MSNCTNCGAGLPAGARFCESCGTAVQSGCESCGEPLAPGSAFCGSCGTAIGSATAPSRAASPATPAAPPAAPTQAPVAAPPAPQRAAAPPPPPQSYQQPQAAAPPPPPQQSHQQPQQGYQQPVPPPPPQAQQQQVPPGYAPPQPQYQAPVPGAYDAAGAAAAQGLPGGWKIGAGYLFAFLGGLIGLALGGHLWLTKVPGPGGAKVPKFNAAARRHGFIIFVIAAVMTAIWIQINSQ